MHQEELQHGIIVSFNPRRRVGGIRKFRTKRVFVYFLADGRIPVIRDGKVTFGDRDRGRKNFPVGETVVFIEGRPGMVKRFASSTQWRAERNRSMSKSA